MTLNNEFKIIVDSNYIYELSTRRLIGFVDEAEKIGELYIPDVVLDELVQKDISSINKINKLIDDRRIFKDIIQIKSINEELVDIIRLYYSNLFNDRIIKFSSVNINKIYERSLLKKPPFSTAKGASDKGFKDSLIWLSILEDSYNDYNQVILLTSDNGFLDNRKDLQKEFFSKHGKDISFFRELPKEQKIDFADDNSNIIDQEKNHFKIIEDFKKLEVIREKLDDILYRITIEREYDPYGEDFLEHQRFTITKRINAISLEELLNNFYILFKENIMSSNIPPNEFLRIFGNVSLSEEKEDIYINDLNDLYKLLYKVNSELSNYSGSIVKAITDYINAKTFEFDFDFNPFDEIDDEELPF